ncbi:hypothetical protein [Salegentibacter mishustinae]|uniref:hypothetical protein n=1 Tax=Salegentibacter mishustinae TaxID=270918 RepID=UPI00248FD96F|nr:hypothetical protein [Salegentibacter mishustinae]
MDAARIGLEQDNGEMLGYNINSEIQNGLYLTTETDLINENIDNFNIDIEVIPNQVATKISKRDKVAIITFVVDESRKYQYLVGADLDIEKMEKMNSKELPEQIKDLVKEAYSLTKKNKLSDLL